MNDVKSLSEKVKKRRLFEFILDVARGFAIGVAFIIPGFSGGSIAAILGIYEKLVGAVADIFKIFIKSFLTLLPIGIGMILGVVSLLFPLGWALSNFPFPTVCIFVGLAVGGLPSITDKTQGKIKVSNIFAFIIPFLFAALLSALPTGADVNLFNLNFGGYVLLVLIGVLGSSALVIPGISGSMLLLILGYYNPIIELITKHLFAFRDVSVSLAVLGSVALGIGAGFVGISVIMKTLLAKYPRGTYIAILGFILGSIPTIYISVAKDSGYTLETLPTSPVYWAVCVLMLAVGFAISFSLVVLSKKEKNEKLPF